MSDPVYRSFRKRGPDRRKANYEKLLRLHSECIGFCIKYDNETTLAQAICDLAITRAGYTQSFIGYAEQDEKKTFRIIAQQGIDAVQFPELSWGPDHPSGQGLIGECIRSRQAIAFNPWSPEYTTEFWQQAAKKIGFDSSIAIPIIIENDVIGAMLFFANAEGPVDEAEIYYLERLVADLAYAIRFIRLQRREQDATRTLTIEAEKRQRLEQQLAESRHMESIGRLAGGVAHDFNNKLAIISSNLEMLQASLVKYPHETERVLAAMRATKNASDLVNGLLAYARRQPLIPQVIDVVSTLREIKRQLETTMPANVQISIDNAKDTWPVTVDPSGFEAAITNLLKNAQDAIRLGGGKITISTRNLSAIGQQFEAPEASEGDYTCIEVADNGCGIAQDILPRVFEPFFTTKAPGRGTGLGLASAYGFARQSGGILKIKSQVDEGTILSLYLPKAIRPITNHAPSNQADQCLPPRCTILVVEDEPELCANTSIFLRELGMQAFECNSTMDTVNQLLSNSKIDVLFTDVRLQDSVLGPALIKKIKSFYPWLKIIVTSGNIDMGVLSTITGMEGVVYLPKPYTRQMVTDCLRQMIAPNGQAGG
ncbi:MAG: GAF domain-containing protein [Desulfovibrio sp.]|uniref:GAF domain-containing hybrid sensor histidine kinase/response regulator n=1 Tax=Desulfovibrio sp. TaxID=885 RepID=UPI00135D1EBA|nr:ATP-binding protein [Desulfovibrio sp.]MTJ93874.1 GAF domain-containing protein [Desulfovibrio sp.]